MSRLSFFPYARRHAPLLLLGLALTLSCMHNRPEPPAIPVGPASVEVDWEYPFKAWTVGLDSGSVHLRFDWGDGDTSAWVFTGETAEYSHSWSHSGTYQVRAQAHDNRPELSEWSDPRGVTCLVPPHPYRLVDSVTVTNENYPLIEAQVLPDGDFIYVASEWSASLSVVRTADLQLVAQIPFFARWWGGDGGGRLACSPDGEYVYATYYRGDYLAAVSTSGNVVVDSLFLGGADMTSIAISPDGHRLYVAVSDDTGYVLAVRLPDFVLEDTIFMSGMSVYISSMTISPDGTRLYAADLGEDCILSVRLSDHGIEWRAFSNPGDEPGALVLHATGSPLYVLSQDWIWVHESGTGSLIDSIAFTPFWNADVAPDGSVVYVTCGGYYGTKGAVAVIRTSDNEVGRFVDFPDYIYDVAASPDGQRLYAAAGNGKLYVLGR
jgi:DNA-binding beta-propeller fold protein YncE